MDVKIFATGRYAMQRHNIIRICIFFGASLAGERRLKKLSTLGTGANPFPYPMPKGSERQRTMNGFPESASSSMQTPPYRMNRSRQPGDFVYQPVTIAAMLLLLGSLWVF
jgi:hypothetical protein